MFDHLDCTKVDDVVTMLNMLYASEIISAQQYWSHANDISGMYSVSIQQMLNAHAEEEMEHAAKLRTQIHNLGGVLTNRLETMLRLNPTPDSDKDVQVLRPSGSALVDAEKMLQDDLMGEEQAILNYKEACRKVVVQDPGTYVILAEILNDEYDHAQEIKNLLAM